jgi:glycosyltransferase involved in cell wall biosynthesis
VIVPGESGSDDRPPRWWCVIVTYRRPQGLARVLSALAEQDRRPDGVLVVDHEPSDGTAAAVTEARRAGVEVRVLEPGENLGPAGGTALAMETILDHAHDEDWILRFDDDAPTLWPDLIAELERFAADAVARWPMVGAVGAVGARYDWRRGRLVRVPDEEVVGAIPVDYVATNNFASFRVAAVRSVGPLRAELFYGSSEVEYGLRLRRAGWRVLADGDLWQRLGRQTSSSAGPRRSLEVYGWRRWYSLRNQVWLLRHFGHPWVALRVALVRGVGKPLVNLPRQPRLAAHHLRMNLRAVIDGWRGRLGRTLEPEVPPP